MLILKKNEDRRLKNGHLWIYSNEINVSKSPLQNFTPGQQVTVIDHHGNNLGTAYVNPHSLIAARLISCNAKQFLDEALLKERIQQAFLLRSQCYNKPFYRLVYGESDALPGLVIDRFDNIFVVQINTAGMEQCCQAIINCLVELFSPQGIWLRADSSMRALEGLEQYCRIAYGEVPESIQLEENDVRFCAPLTTGQKTGWFYDHRENRAQLKRFVKDKRVLDVFSYVGSFGIQAAAFGAAEVCCIDASALAIDYVNQNAALNQITQRVQTIQSDAFEAMTNLRQQNQRYDVIILDPPAFIKRRKDLTNGLIAYRRINQLALQLLAKNGLLISASCSHHLASEQLMQTVCTALQQQKRSGRVIYRGQQGFDHPIHPAIPETAYLKADFVAVE